MRIQEPIETSGKFWLPDDPNTKLSGDLNISESGRIALRLNGVFVDWVTAYNKMIKGEMRPIDRILGQVGLGNFVTLDNCLLVRSGISTSELYVELAYFGVHYDKGEEAKFTKFRFSVEELDKWLAVSGFKIDSETTHESGSIQFSRPKNIKHVISDDLELEFGFLTSYDIPFLPSITEVRIVQNEFVSLISSEPRDIDYFNSLALKLCFFWSLALDQVVSIQYVTVFPAGGTQSEGESEGPRIQVYGQFRPWTASEPTVRWHNILFGYSDIEDRFEEYLSNWIRNYEAFEPAFNLYLVYRFDDSQFVDVRFLQLMQGFEVLHRRMYPDQKVMEKSEFRSLHKAIRTSLPENCPKTIRDKIAFANELPLSDRIRGLIEPFQHWFIDTEESEEFIKKVANTRNYLTHYRENLESKAAKGQELILLYDKLEVLFRLHLLRLIGFEAEQIDSMFSENSRLREIFKASDLVSEHA